jgi:hypothetical protein
LETFIIVIFLLLTELNYTTVKRPFCLSGIYLRITLSLFIISFSFPLVSFSQNKEVNIVVTCVEYIGNGTFKANFGYDNPDTRAVTVDQTSSVVTYNYGQSKKFALNTFLPGRQENVFSQEFSTKDRVEWTVILPSGVVKVVTADINSNHCRDVGDIIPYYTPPPGGKVSKKSLIGAELTSLYNTYISLYPNFNAKSDFIFQLRVINGVYQVYIEAISIGPTASLKTQLTGSFNLALKMPQQQLTLDANCKAAGYEHPDQTIIMPDLFIRELETILLQRPA